MFPGFRCAASGWNGLAWDRYADYDQGNEWVSGVDGGGNKHLRLKARSPALPGFALIYT
jgi:hypothetical protein